MWKNCVGVVVLGSITLACSGAGHSGFGNHNGGAPADSGPIDTGPAPGLDGGGGMLPPSGPTFGTTCTGAATTLTGTVYAPNGTDPLPNIYVYIAGKVNPFPPGNYCNQCSKPLDVWYTETQSAADGTFSLDLSMVPSGSTASFVVNVGSFRKVTTIPVSCGANTAPALASTLPGKSADGDIPKIAVTTGNSDHLDQILNVLGITEYDCYEGRASTSSTPTCTPIDTAVHLLEKTSAKTIDDYNLLFVSCAPNAYKTFGTPTIASNTSAFVTAGGRLFATDMSYDYVAQAFPSAITWMGPSGAPQPVNGANVGVAGSYTGKIDDPSLVTWLNKLGATTGATVPLQGFLNPWSVQASIPSSSNLIVDGTVSYSGGSGDVPLTTEFDVSSCGRVIYSSYHTAGGSVMAGSLLLPELRRAHAPRRPGHRPQAGPPLPSWHRRTHRATAEGACARTALLEESRAAARGTRRARRVER